MREITKRTREAGLAWPGSLGRLHEEMDRMFNRFFGELRPMEVVGSFVVDVNEDDEHIYIRAELPGLTREDIELTLENGLLTIGGEKKRETLPGREDLQERYYGRIYRSLTLPSGVDETKVKATMKDGILNIVLDKTPESKPRRIPIE
jgi:HSP20 family protein